MKLDHLCLHVRNNAKSSEWYRQFLGLELEFENLENGLVALKDEAELGLLLFQDEAGNAALHLEIYFQVPNVDELHARLSSQGLRFDHPPESGIWGATDLN
jgi:catechol 2,3-dioxygenase-like lactoylglutathione lyase family enzyme